LHKRVALFFLVVAAAGIAYVLWRGAADERVLTYSLGAGPSRVVAVIEPGREVCQKPIELPASSEGVNLPLGTNHSPGTALTVTARDMSGRPLGQGFISPGYADGSTQGVWFSRRLAAGRISLCIRNSGSYPAYPYGTDGNAQSGTVVAGRVSPDDIDLHFYNRHGPSTLDRVPAAFRHAAVFRFDWVGAWTYWLLAGALVVLVPLLFAFALGRAARDDEALDGE
jgi:hypothetical protein